MELQNAFYIIGIIFMSLMLLILLAIVAAVFTIKAKINHLHNTVEEKIHNVANIGEKVSQTAKKVLGKR